MHNASGLFVLCSRTLAFSQLSIATIVIATLYLSIAAHAQIATDSTNVVPVPTSKPENGAIGAPSFLPTPTSRAVFPDVTVRLRLEAHAEKEKTPIKSGMVWRIYHEEEGPDGKLPLIGTYSGGSAIFNLKAGYYLVHGSFGYSGLTKRIKVLPPVTDAAFAMKAGGLRLNAAFREGDIIPPKNLSFDIAQKENDDLKTIATDVRADELIRLSEGNYHVTSRYGTINSSVSADVRVTSGELTELTLYQRGAEITLKLVSERGGEALANTSWTVLTPAGDPVVNTIQSAFPSFVLAAGDYIAFARHEDKNYSASFTIESGVHRDVEVILE